MNRRRWLMFVVALVLSLGGLYFLLRDLDVVRLQAALELVDYRLFSISLLIAVLSQALPPLRWRILLDKAASYWNCASALLIGNLISALVPLRLGEVARAGLIRQSEAVPLATSLLTIVAGHILDVLSLLLLGFVLLLLVPLPPELLRASVLLAVGVIIGLVSICFIWRFLPRRANPDARFASSRLSGTFRAVAHKFLPSLLILRKPSRLAWAASLSVGFWLITTFASVFLLLSLVRANTLALAVMLTFTAGIGRLLPALPGSIGTVDAAVLLGLTSLGVVHDEAVALVLLLRLRYVLMTGITGAFGLVLQALRGSGSPVYTIPR